MRGTVALGLFVLFTAACAESKGSAPASQGAASGAPASAAAAAAIAPGGTITGTLREQIPVGPYVYVRLATANGEIWAAVASTPLTDGAEITVYNVLPMDKFASPTLSRTFERIYFGALQPTGSAGTAATAESAPAPMSVGHPPLSGSGGSTAGGTPPAEDAQVGPVARASGANARTIGELWAQPARIVGTTVSVRGVVVKYNPGVMGKNWIHLQDGSGDAKAGTHDLAVTSLDAAAVGDTVTITGTVRTNRDVGAGYVYALLIEEARVARK